MLLSKHTLGTLVRECAMQAYHTEKLVNEGTISQFQLRQQFIDDLFYKYKRETTLEEFYASLFTALPDGQAMGIVGPGAPAPLPRSFARALCRTPASAKTHQFGKGSGSLQQSTSSDTGSGSSPAIASPSPRTPPLNGGAAAGASASASASSSSSSDPKGFGRVAPRTKPTTAPSSTLRMGVRGRRGEEEE
jgi:hypothetical protein